MAGICVILETEKERERYIGSFLSLHHPKNNNTVATMTLQRVDSDLGNSSCSSMASFLNDLLQEKGGGRVTPDQIDIVDDNAKREFDFSGAVPRCRSLVSLRRQRSGRQLSRWSSKYERKDSDPNLMTLGNRSSSPMNGFRKCTSDTTLLTLPARTVSPKLTCRAAIGGSRSSGRSGNATWSQADVQQSSRRPNLFDLTITLSPETNEKASVLDRFEGGGGVIPLQGAEFFQGRHTDCTLKTDVMHEQIDAKNKLFDVSLVGIPVKPMRRGSILETTGQQSEAVSPLPTGALHPLAQSSINQRSGSSGALFDTSLVGIPAQPVRRGSVEENGGCQEQGDFFMALKKGSGSGTSNNYNVSDVERRAKAAEQLLRVAEGSSTIVARAQAIAGSRSSGNFGPRTSLRGSSSSSHPNQKGLRRKVKGQSLASFEHSLTRMSSGELRAAASENAVGEKPTRRYLTDPSLLGLNVKIAK